ncbi:MAG: hypothetical protein SPI72_01860 [Porphyromonas sp.]|nr:hypothetical protein [Porphyromonas sp.]
MKYKFVKLLVALLLLGYACWAVFYFSDREEKSGSRAAVCRAVTIEFFDKEGSLQMDEADVIHELKRLNCYPVGKNVDSVSLSEIEYKLSQLGLFKEAEAYLTSNNKLHLKLTFNRPYFFVQLQNDAYYVTKERRLIPISTDYSIPLLVASGHIDSLMAVTKIYDLVEVIEHNTIWQKLFSQIYVKPDGDISLLMRVAETEVILGKTPNWEEKLDKLQVFIKQVTPRIGWDKYSSLNLKFSNQIVAKRLNPREQSTPSNSQ